MTRNNRSRDGVSDPYRKDLEAFLRTHFSADLCRSAMHYLYSPPTDNKVPYGWDDPVILEESVRIFIEEPYHSGNGTSADLADRYRRLADELRSIGEGENDVFTVLLKRFSRQAGSRMDLLRENSDEREEIRRWLAGSSGQRNIKPAIARTVLTVSALVLGAASAVTLVTVRQIGPRPLFAVLCFWGVFFLYLLLRSVKKN